MFINKVNIKNFQSHRDTTIDFANGINSIVGESDKGKSAILRAIRWCIFNEPKGTDFISLNTDQAEVTIYLSNGYIIKRIRNNKTLNRYELTTPDGNTTNYDNFGTEIPEEVRLATEFSYFKEDDIEELNIASQGNSNSILHTSSANRARIFNIFTGLDKLDTALSSLRKDKLQLSKEAKILDANKTELVDRLNTYEYIDELEIYLDKLKALKEKAVKIQNYIGKLNGIWNYYEQSKNSLNTINSELSKYSNIKTNEDLYNELNDVIANLSNVNRLDVAYKVSSGLYTNINDKLANMLDADLAQKCMDKLNLFIDKFNKINNLSYNIKNNSETKDSLSKSINMKNEQLSNLKEDYMATLKENKVCPTCFRSIEEDFDIEDSILL